MRRTLVGPLSASLFGFEEYGLTLLCRRRVLPVHSMDQRSNHERGQKSD